MRRILALTLALASSPVASPAAEGAATVVGYASLPGVPCFEVEGFRAEAAGVQRASWILAIWTGEQPDAVAGRCAEEARHLHITVDCIAVDGRTAYLSGQGSDGPYYGVRIDDGGPTLDAAGYSRISRDLSSPTCNADAIPTAGITGGDLAVAGA